MTSSEVVELWEATMTKVFKTTLAEGKNVQPVKFAGMDGFRFDFNYVPKDEVDRKGVGFGAVKDGRLYLIFFSGTKLYHYGQIGRASCRERVCQYVYISVVAVSLKNKLFFSLFFFSFIHFSSLFFFFSFFFFFFFF